MQSLHMEKRTDRLMAANVDLAFNISLAFGLDSGIRTLHEEKAPSSVIQRVLIDGGPRRGATWSRLEPPSHGDPCTGSNKGY
jgi:hypothetical protein